MSEPLRMMRDMLGQPASLAAVLEHQTGAGKGDLEAAAGALRAAARVLITGMGASLFSATPLFYWLRERGVDCSVMEAGELLHFGGKLKAGTVVVLVSRSGETVEAIRLLPVLKDAGAVVVGVTNEPGTTLAREADLPVLVNSGRDEIIAVQTYTGTSLAMLLLGAAVSGEDRRAEAEGAIAESGELLRAYEGEDWPGFLSGVPVVYVLGRGPSWASAQEGALLFQETAKMPAVSMPGAGFRHGPVEAVDAGFRAFVFTSQERTRALDEALARKLTGMGAQVRTVAVQAGAFAPVVEIVPLQFAAYQAALLRGVTPGVFRHTGQVTTSESDF